MYTFTCITMRVRRVYDRSALFLLWFALCWTNEPFLNRRHYRSCESTNWPGKYDSRLNFLPPRRDSFYPPLHVRSTHETAGILLHSTCNYSSKDVLFITSIPHGWTDDYAITDSFLQRNLSKRRRMKRHRRPCFYYPNSSAAFNLELLGDLTFKLNPGPPMNRTIPVIVSSQAKRSHASRPITVSYNVTPGSKNCCPRGVNRHNLISIRGPNKKLQNSFVPIDFCLLNTRSNKKKEIAIKDYAVDNNVDIFAVTETWLRNNENYNFSIAEVCPTGYRFYHVPRKNSRGGGVGLLIKKHMKVTKQTQRNFSSFEYLDIVTTCSTGSIRIVTIYRPPPSKANQLNRALFFEEFCTLAEQLVVSPGNLLLVGDFNYHVDNISNPDTVKFNKILESFSLVQHVNGPTHKKGHTLDLIITRAVDELVTSVEIRDPMLSDHSAIHCKLRLKKPPLERMETSYRKLRSVNMDSFNDDLKQSDLLTTNTFDLTGLIEKYENTLTETLQRHAPLKRRMITLRPSAPWYHEGISDLTPRENVGSWSAAGDRRDCVSTDRCMSTSAR